MKIHDPMNYQALMNSFIFHTNKLILTTSDEAKLQLDVCMGGNVIQELASYPNSLIDYDVEPNSTCTAEVFGKSRSPALSSSVFALAVYIKREIDKRFKLYEKNWFFSLSLRPQLGFHSTLCSQLWALSWF